MLIRTKQHTAVTQTHLYAVCKSEDKSAFDLHIRALEDLKGTPGANAAINVGRVTYEGS